MLDRNDFIRIFNHARFLLRHYALGYYPVAPEKMSSMPVNRLFIPLENPNGEKNFITEAGKTHVLTPGYLYFVPAYHPAQFRLDETLFFLSIQTNVEIFPGVELFSDCPRMTVIPNPPQVAELLDLVHSDEARKHTAALRAGTLVFSMQSALVDFYSPEDFWKPLALHEFAPLTEYLRKQGNARTSVSDLAALQCVSRETFTRHFSRRTGLTPKELIDRFVIRHCLDLLNGGHSVKETAALLQFSNEFVFSRYFKRNIGESPRYWLKRSRFHS